METTTFAQQEAAWKNGEYALYPHCNDFYDWFCKDSSLEGRANKLKGLAKKLVDHLDLDKIGFTCSSRTTAQCQDHSTTPSASATESREM